MSVSTISLSSAPTLKEIDAYLASGADPVPALTILRARSLKDTPAGKRALKALDRLQSGKSAAPWADLVAEREQAKSAAPQAKPVPSSRTKRPAATPVKVSHVAERPNARDAAVVVVRAFRAAGRPIPRHLSAMSKTGICPKKV